jgi:hypothetical protein
MSLTYSYPTLSNPISRTEIQQNFADLAAKFGNITSADILSTASITASQLAGAYYEFWVQLRYNGGAFPAANTILDAVPLPGDSTDSSYSLVNAAWICTDPGNGAAKFSVVQGTYGAAGAWSTYATHIAAQTLAITYGADLPDQGNCALGTLTIANSATQRSLALMVHTQGANALSAAGSYLNVSLCLRRQIHGLTI